MGKFITGLTIAIALVILGFVYFRFYYVYGRGVSEGQLNYVVQRGYLFKTYEGKQVQGGLESKLAGALQSPVFLFSVTEESVARKLMLCGNSNVKLHYKEYLGGLPWRGESRFIVDSIISISPPTPSDGIH